MENNNQNANWQQAINDLSATAADQVNETVQNVQPEQPAPVQDNSMFAPQNDMNTYDAGNFAVLPAKQKSNKTLIIVLVIVAAAILIGGGIFLLLSMNKGSGYESLERNYFAGLSESLNTVTAQTKTGADMKITLTPGATLTNGMDVAPTVLKGKAYADAESLKTYAELTYAAGDTDILGAKIWFEDQIMYVQIPDLSDATLKMDINELAGMMGSLEDLTVPNAGLAPMMENTDTIGALPANPLAGYTEMLESIDEKTMEKIFNVLVDAYFDTAKNCTKTSTGTLQCGEVSMNCDINTITFTSKNLMDYVLTLLNKAEADADIMELLAGFGLDKATLSSAKTYVEEAVKSMPEEAANQVFFTMTVYSKGNDIVGRVINIANSGEIRIITANDGSKFATEFSLNSGTAEPVKFIATGSVTGDKYDGTFELSSESNETPIAGNFSLTMNDYVNGSISISGETDGVKEEIKLTLETSAKNFKIGVEMITDGSSAVKLEIESNEIAYTDVALPTGTMVDVSNASDPNMNKFAEDVNNNAAAIMTKITSLDKPDMIASLFAAFGAMGAPDVA